MHPTVQSVKKAMREFDRIGSDAFLLKYSSGFPPLAHYVRHQGKNYPLKSVWAAAHQPPIHSGNFNTGPARSGLKKLGFHDFVATSKLTRKSSNSDAMEGERTKREIDVILRHKGIVERAKKESDYTCEACGFDFQETYGDLGKHYIEAHHIEPLSGRDGVNEPTSIDDFAMLCANCHRMVHRRTPCLTVEELIEEMDFETSLSKLEVLTL